MKTDCQCRIELQKVKVSDTTVADSSNVVQLIILAPADYLKNQ